MDPLGPTAGGLHGSALLGTQQTLWLKPQGTRPAQPAALWDLEDSIAGLVKPRQHRKEKRERKKRFIFPTVSMNFKTPFEQHDPQNRGPPRSTGPRRQDPFPAGKMAAAARRV